MADIVTRMSIIKPLGLFIGYMVIHFLIGLALRKKIEEVKDNGGVTDEIRKLELAFKWFPAAYLVFAVIILIV